MAELQEAPYSGRTAWARNLETPLRDVPAHRDRERGASCSRRPSRRSSGSTSTRRRTSASGTPTLSIRVGGAGVSQDLRHWVNSGLMTFFFFVVGLEARREFDIGELRERRRSRCRSPPGSAGWSCRSRSTWPSTPAAPSAHGWGVAMSTDTAFALGLLALVGPRFPIRLRAFMLTVSVVDDVVALRRDRDRLHGASAPCGRCCSPPALVVVVVALARRSASATASCTSCSASRPGSRCSSRASIRSSSGSSMGLLTYASPGRARRPRAGDRPLPALPRAADAGARALGDASACSRRSRRTSGCSSSTTRGRAT